jgi:gluconate kinase
MPIDCTRLPMVNKMYSGVPLTDADRRHGWRQSLGSSTAVVRADTAPSLPTFVSSISKTMRR